METTVFSSKLSASIILFFLGVFTLFSAPIDSDFGWHMRYGKLISEERVISLQNTFSFTFHDYQWANSYWLSQVVEYTLFDTFGAIGFSLILSVLFVACILVLLNSASLDLRNIVFPTALILIFLSSYELTVRPLFFSTLFTILLTYIFAYNPRKIPYLPILFLFWANMHADFLLGLGITGVFVFAYLVEKRLTLANLASVVIAGLVTLINPFGVKLYETLLKETHPFQFQYILEWRPLWENSSYAVFFMVFVIALLYLLYWNRMGLGFKLIFLVFFILSIRFSYFSRMLLLTSFFPLLEIFSYLLVDLKKLLNEGRFSFLLYSCKALVFLLVVLLAFGFFTKVNLASSTRSWSNALGYPYEAVIYLKENNMLGNTLNFYGWGGYLVWYLPESKVFIDGRMPSWRENGYSVFEDYVSIALDKNKETGLLSDYITQYSIKYALLPWDSTFVDDLLKLGWEVAYTDNIAVILKSP